MPGDTAASLRLANDNLSAGLARLQPESNAPWLLKPEDLSGLLAVVLRAARCRRSLASDAFPSAELEKEIGDYRYNMEELAKVLPSVLGRLLAEKARLQNAHAQLTAAGAWARASKNTL
jgi:hypothetical protein